MHQETLDRLNGVLVDHLGRNPFGGPYYFWARSRDVMIPVLSKEKLLQKNGIWRYDPHYVWEPQIEQECWLLAGWIEPVPKSVWVASFGEEVLWPAQGMHYVTDVILKPGIEPNDEATNSVIGKVNAFRRMNERQIWDWSRDKHRRIDEASEKEIGDFVRDKAVNHIPGVCGPVSYPLAKQEEITPLSDLCPKP